MRYLYRRRSRGGRWQGAHPLPGDDPRPAEGSPLTHRRRQRHCGADTRQIWRPFAVGDIHHDITRRRVRDQISNPVDDPLGRQQRELVARPQREMLRGVYRLPDYRRPTYFLTVAADNGAREQVAREVRLGIRAADRTDAETGDTVGRELARHELARLH